MRRLAERQEAARIVRPEHYTPDGADSLLAAARAVWSGTDLDFDEVGEVAIEQVGIVAAGIRAQGLGALAPLVAGVFAEGMRAGLLIAEAREREAARSWRR
jgi:hypothetical protein